MSGAEKTAKATARARTGGDRDAESAGEKARPLLRVDGLVTEFRTDAGTVRAVDDVSFTVGRGRTLGIVGESGCGKSVTSLSIMRLIPTPPGKIASGQILFDGLDLASLSDRQMCNVRGNDIGMIFQEPMTSLNPVYNVGSQIAESLILHRKLSVKAATKQAVEMLRRVGIPSPEQRVKSFPHEMSGGMKQRVMIAMALSCDPKLLIADEPTTALDVTIQAQILDLLRKLQKDAGMAILFISHDLGVIAEMAHDVVVMYAGRVVEQGDVESVFKRPVHPYTIGLFHSIPRVGQTHTRLNAIPGAVPTPLNYPMGCRFNNRCPFAVDKCREAEPQLESHAGEARLVRCHRAGEVAADDWASALQAAAAGS